MRLILSRDETAGFLFKNKSELKKFIKDAGALLKSLDKRPEVKEFALMFDVDSVEAARIAAGPGDICPN